MALLLGGCIKEDTDGECASGLKVSFFSVSRCQSSPTYPENISDISLFIFDRAGLLTAAKRLDNVHLTASLADTVTVGNGLYTVVAWAGLDRSFFDLNSWQIGVTTKDELLLRVLRTGDQAHPTDGASLYYGESGAVLLQAGKSESVFESVSVNLLEVTNRITVTVEGLPDNGDDYEIVVEADNGAMNIDGTVARDDLLRYEPVVTAEGGVLQAEYTLLKLETGHTYTIALRNSATGADLFRGSLLGALILLNPNVDLACDHDFDLRFTVVDQCNCGTYAIAEIWVNNWLVHTYGLEM